MDHLQSANGEPEFHKSYSPLASHDNRNGRKVKVEMKKECKNCTHFYRVMAKDSGYNPFPCCQLFDDTGERPRPLTRECFEPKKKPKKEVQK